MAFLTTWRTPAAAFTPVNWSISLRKWSVSTRRPKRSPSTSTISKTPNTSPMNNILSLHPPPSLPNNTSHTQWTNGKHYRRLQKLGQCGRPPTSLIPYVAVRFFFRISKNLPSIVWVLVPEIPLKQFFSYCLLGQIRYLDSQSTMVSKPLAHIRNMVRNQ